jgi:hypothetical protein
MKMNHETVYQVVKNINAWCNGARTNRNTR